MFGLGGFVEIVHFPREIKPCIPPSVIAWTFVLVDVSA
jgi:hypothetical protein